MLRAEPDLVPERALVMGDPGRAEMAARAVSGVRYLMPVRIGGRRWRCLRMGWGRRLFGRETDCGRKRGGRQARDSEWVAEPGAGRRAGNFGLPRRIREVGFRRGCGPGNLAEDQTRPGRGLDESMERKINDDAN